MAAVRKHASASGLVITNEILELDVHNLVRAEIVNIPIYCA
jgi:hypothetical protein